MSINKMFLRETDECRICMGTKTNKVSLFQNNLSLKITILADVEVTEGDGLPSTICADCETDLEKFYEFRAQVQLADKKFREDLCLSQIDIEDCNIKQEQCEGSTEERSDSSNSHHYSVDNKTNIVKETDQQDDDDHIAEPIKHVEITDNTEREANVMTDDPLGQDEPLIEAYIMNLDNEPNQDPLTSTKEEPVPMDSNGHTAETSIPPSSTSLKEEPVPMNCNDHTTETSIPSSSVKNTVPASSYVFSPEIVNNCKEKYGNQNLQQKQANYFVMSPIYSPNMVIAVNRGLNQISNDGVTNRHLTNISNVTSYNHALTSNVTLIPELGLKNVKWPGSNPNQETTGLIKPSSNHLPFLIKVKPNVLINTIVMANKDLQISNAENNRTNVPTATTGTCVTQGTFQSHDTISDHIENQTKANSETIATIISDSSLSLNFGGPFCSICNISFITTELLNEHKEKKEYFCRICTLSFHSHNELEIHFVSHIPFKCKMCKKMFFSQKDLFNHRMNSSTCNVKIECELCRKTFFNKRGLMAHKRKAHSNKNSYKCVVCGKLFTYSKVWKDHLRSTHSAFEYMECKLCCKFVLGPTKLKNHIKYVHLENDETCPFKCSICGKVFKREVLLKNHQFSHNDTIMLCEICGKPMKGKKSMASHIKREHVDKKGSFSCKLCKKSFVTEHKLNDHIKKSAKHRTSTKVVYCEICGKSYRSKRILMTHQQIHSDDKPFKCKLCGATFKQKVALVTHGRVHSSVGKYRCNACGMTFRWKQTFDKHVKNCENVDDDEDEVEDIDIHN